MTRSLLRPFIIFAALTSGCTQIERGLADGSPTAASSIVVPSLIGTWKSTGQNSVGNSCANLQLRVTGQTGDSLSGEFSADCVGNISASGSASGQINGKNVSYQITGTAQIPASANTPAVPSCPFSISGTATIESDAIRIPYNGTTCLGPIHGEEVLRQPAQSTPAPAPAPAPPPDPPPSPTPPPPPPPPSGSSYHVPPGPLTSIRAEQVVLATRDEFPSLVAPRSTDAASVAAAAELLRRMIWHLQVAGFQAGRQKNPSGAISNDKMTVFGDGGWHAYDVFRNVGTAGQKTDVIFLEVFPASYMADGGIPDF